MKLKLLLITIGLFVGLISSYGQTYNQITLISELTNGDYLIVGDGTTTDGIMLNTITAATPYVNYTAVTNPGASITTGFTSANVFTINVSGGNITIFNSNLGYVSWGRTGNTGNIATFFNGTVATTEQWTPTVAAGLWTLANVNTAGRLLQWNNASPRFAAYTSAQVKLKLYKLAAASTPTVTTFSPLDNASGVSTTGNLSLVFNENVAAGISNILIKRSSDNTIFETIAVTSGLVTISGGTVTINPAGTFANSTGYYVEIPAGAIEDTAGNDYAGISGTTTWNFTTEAIWTNPITGINPNNANPYTTGQTFNTNITVSGIGRGSGIVTNDANNRYNANGWESTSYNANDYFEFTLTPNVGYEINFIDFVYTSERSGNPSEGPTNFAFRSSVDNYSANIGTPTFNGTTISLSGAAYQNRTTATTFRIYAWGADAATRTFSINDFTFNGTVIQTTLATDYFRSRVSGTWATAGNWESSRDNTNWITSTLAPTSAANTITIRNTHTITISGAVTADQITVLSGGTLALNGADLTLNNGIGTDLTIDIGGTFDNGGENQITRTGTPSISISGTFITRDEQGFVGITTAIPDISTILNTGSTIEYGRAGNQEVQGTTAPTYSNITFSGTGTKTLQSANSVTGTVTIKDTAIFNSSSFTFGGSGTNLTMTDTSRLIVSGARSVPDMEGTYTLTGGTIEFAGNSNSHTARSPLTYNNVVISGLNVNGSAGNYTLRNGATFTVNAGGVFTVTDQRIIAGGASATLNINGSFVTRDADGFYGTNATSISPTNTILNLGLASTIEYAGASQSITSVPITTGYSNLTVSGTGTKTIPSQLFLGNDLAVSASTLRIESGKDLTVTNKVDVIATATMIIEDSGSLVQVNDAAVNTGNIRYERNYTGILPFDYTYWSSPVANQNLLALSPTTKTDKFYSFDAAANDWLQENPSTRTMEFGKGFIIRAAPITGGPVGFLTNTFIGEPHNGARSISVIADKSYLLGNPYPSSLNAEKFLNDNSGVLNGTLYFWTHNTDIQLYTDIIAAGGTPGSGVLAYTSDDYAAYNATGGVAVTQRDIDPDTGLPYPGPSPSGSVAPTGKIATGQGFFASTKTTLSGTIILYNNSMRLSSDTVPVVLDNSEFFKTKNPKTKTSAFEKHRLWLNLSNKQGLFKQTLIGYLTDATNQYDNRFDGESFDGNQFADFYSVNQDKNLVIQGRALPFDENDEVPLGFRTTIDGAFTINIDQADGVLTNQSVFIEDKLTKTLFDLKSGSYTFTTKSGTFNDRFILRYINKTLGTEALEILGDQVFISNKNKQIKINSAHEIIDKVTVYDLLGRQLFQKKEVSSKELIVPTILTSQQTLLVKVIMQNGQTVTKKILY